MSNTSKDPGKTVREADKRLGNKGPATSATSNEAQRHKVEGKKPGGAGGAKDRVKGAKS